MIRKHWKKLSLASLLTLLPIAVGLLLWDRLPQTLATHWGLDGQADGYGSLPFAVFILPLIMLAVHWLCIFLTAQDPKNQDRNEKPFGMVIWVVPVISNLCSYMMYALALGIHFSVTGFMNAAFGLMFLLIGNYLPKCRQNYTIGFKLSWTLNDEGNWNATHRFGGKVWVVGGLVIFLSAFLPGSWGIGVMCLTLIVICVIPIVYSYLFYRKKCRAGTPPPKQVPVSIWDKRLGTVGLILVAAILIFSAVLLFTGTIRVRYDDTSFTVEASYYDDLTVDYDAIASVEYRQGNVDGLRAWGFGSFRLLMGRFQNEEFGNYTRYTYYAPEACVVLDVGGKALVLSGKNEAQTREIYEQLLLRTGL